MEVNLLKRTVKLRGEEIRLTAKMIEAGAELCKIKLHPAESKAEAAKLAAYIDAFMPEYIDLWLLRNFEMGIARSRDHLMSRSAELKALAEG